MPKSRVPSSDQHCMRCSPFPCIKSNMDMSSIHALQGAGEDTRLLQEGVACCSLTIEETITSWTFGSDYQGPNIQRSLLRSGVPWRDPSLVLLGESDQAQMQHGQRLWHRGKCNLGTIIRICGHHAFVWAIGRASEVPRHRCPLLAMVVWRSWGASYASLISEDKWALATNLGDLISRNQCSRLEARHPRTRMKGATRCTLEHCMVKALGRMSTSLMDEYRPPT
ncbi:GTPase Obg [Fusarium oxysporum f. sp. albedinis]|nr:GTPase Obg [Fusarium oxysporum f. sp. albedinis]